MIADKYSLYRFWVVIFLLVVCVHDVHAQGFVNNATRLKNGSMVKGLLPAEWSEKHKSTAFPVQVLIRFDVLPGEEERQLLKSNGIALSEYIPTNTYTAVLLRMPDEYSLSELGVDWLADVNPAWKIDAELLAADKSNDLSINVLLSEAVTESAAIAYFKRHNIPVLTNRIESMRYCTVLINSLELKQLAGWYGVSYISQYSEDQPLNIDAKAATRMQIAAAPVSLGGYGLKGKDIAIGVGDNTSGMFHVDLRDRIINYNPQGYTNHGVHINGIVGGGGIKDPKGEGMAPLATLTNHYFSDVLEATPYIFEQNNVVATNNSYSAFRGSCEYAGTYDAIAAGLDNLCLDYDKVLQVFAAANDGLFDCKPFPQGYATIAGGYQPAKNAIVVASTDKLYNNADNSSRGPVKDGRLKPEITAVGKDVNSTTRNDEYLVASGTSMACPQVAGAAALLAERMKQIDGTVNPRSDVLKALLINGADDIGTEGPDYKFGFGFLNAERSLMMLDSNRYITGSIGNGTQNTHNINVPAGVSSLKVLLYWHDAAASPMAAIQLVDDLDIEVSGGSGNHKPLVLNPAPENVLDKATEQTDRLNNVEQVVINNPIPGNYTIRVNGHSVPSGSRNYVVVYDFLPEGISVKYPITGSQVKADDSIYVYWNATNGSGTFKLEYSIDNGGQWNVIDNNIPASQRHYLWNTPTGVNSGQCRIRLSRNAEVSTTELFAITDQSVVVLSDVQCPGYIQVKWDAIANATSYQLLRQYGPELVIEDTVGSGTLSYVFADLDQDSVYYVAVRPIVDNMSGYRSIGISRKPDDGDCTGSISDGDLMIDRVMAPQTGRKFTSTELSTDALVRVRIKNLDDAPCDSYKVSYKLPGAGWASQTISDPLPAGGQRSINLATTDLSAIGDYIIHFAVENLSMPDVANRNDSVMHTVAQLPNAPVQLGYNDDFEQLGVFEALKDTFGIGADRRWDYQRTSDTGRIRSRVLGSATTISGTYSVSMDAYKSCPGNYNGFMGTFNMAGYSAANDEVRLEFDYIIHGLPKAKEGNEVLVRGKDNSALHKAYSYVLEEGKTGEVLNSGSISLSDVMLNVGSDFSTSTQIQFGQSDTSSIGSRNFGNGVTIDNVRMYTVENDIQLLDIIAPESFACGITGPAALTVKIRNGVSQVLTDVQMNFRLDDGAVVTEALSSINGKEELNYTFSQSLDVSALGSHIVDVWVSANGDTYLKNDSIIGYGIRNQPVITTFPYTEDFEQNDGYWFSEGINNSWEYGAPAATKISGAASGTNAWVTNLDGAYNDNEQSYLYSPCFDISSLETPKLSFQLALDIENCGGILCDAAYVEYTTDGERWMKLGDYNKGTNWYNDSNYLVWTIEDKTMWHQAETYLPDSVGSIQLRYGLYTDPGSNKEGIGIDDIRIYNEVLYPADDNIISISPNPTQDGVIHIEWGAHDGTQLNLVMTDMTGKQVFAAGATAQEGYNKTTLQTPLFNNGMYFMRITIGEKVHKHKIVYLRR